jgi:ATP-dependent Clp protease protease subunit
MRYSMKNTRIMMTQPMGGSAGTWWEISKTVEELNALYQLFCRYYMRFTGMGQDEVEMATCRDNFMTPEDAQQAGLLDGIIRGARDYTAPPSLVRSLKTAGVLDRLSEGVLRVDCEQ